MSNRSRILVGIPTRDRLDYLTILLFSLLEQDVGFDVLIVNTSTRSEGGIAFEPDSPISRISKTLYALGSNVECKSVSVVGYSETVAVNAILECAVERGYGYVFKVDDDHWIPSGTLKRFKTLIQKLDPKFEAPVVVSGVTPWMEPAYSGGAGPDDIAQGDPEEPVTYLERHDEAKTVTAIVNHFVRYPPEYCDPDKSLRETHLASAANFMMRPDTRILWSDTCSRSMYCDAAWFIQLRKLLGYRLYFDLGVNVWHVAAPSGGCRAGENGMLKTDGDNVKRAKFVYQLLKQFEWREKKCT